MNRPFTNQRPLTEPQTTASHSPLHALIHTPPVVTAMRGDSHPIGRRSGQAEASALRATSTLMSPPGFKLATFLHQPTGSTSWETCQRCASSRLVWNNNHLFLPALLQYSSVPFPSSPSVLLICLRQLSAKCCRRWQRHNRPSRWQGGADALKNVKVACFHSLPEPPLWMWVLRWWESHMHICR